MTKILVWNIEHFSSIAISPKTLRGPLALPHILNTLTENPPDIFIILEVRPGKMLAPGNLVQNTGATGCLQLLNGIKKLPGFGANWLIVPPLVSGAGGKCEGVAVFYNSAVVTFQGPYVWTGAASVPAGAVKGNYPVAPHNWKTASGATQFAAQFEHKNAAGVAIDFPVAGCRSPYLTRFQETKAMGRIIDIYSVHTSPATAVAGTAAIAKIPAFAGLAALPANHVVVVAGDFNVTQSNLVKVAASYAQLTAKGFKQEFDAAILPVPGVGVNATNYVTTHLKPIKTIKNGDPDWKKLGIPVRKGANPWGNYPPYGYMSLPPEDTLDNIFTYYPPGAAGAGYPKASVNRMIVNRVVGSPYAGPVAGGIAAHPVPPAPFTYTEALKTTIPAFHALLAAGGNKGALVAAFRNNNNNYRGIRQTSDHMAVYVEV